MPDPTPTEVLLSLGANLGDPIEQLRTAIARLGEIVAIEAVSRVYRAEPVDAPDQPDYFNLACRGRTILDPDALLSATQAIEKEMGREHVYRYGPRLIDIDVLAYGDVMIKSPRLTLPHPRAAERRFVLAPLNDVAPEWRHPTIGKTAAELLAEGRTVGEVEPLGMIETL
ncbi:MAG: 2-amino-4-hydroxy-6-hydroxymethyldihydropteridine diphosphokinase [Gemmatimonadetes bacterium]|nr:2-amino-4-hydroxy-6-hydroxymethyldihydropteridine diphosphokinase [Gemmatimonadota bacterium]